jgi:hypothetical protein
MKKSFNLQGYGIKKVESIHLADPSLRITALAHKPGLLVSKTSGYNIINRGSIPDRGRDFSL